MSDQQVDDGRIDVVLGGVHQRGHAVFIRLPRVRAACQQGFDDGGIFILAACQHQRGDAVFRSGVDVGAHRDQQRDDGGIRVFFGGGHQHRRAEVVFQRGNVGGAIKEQGAHGGVRVFFRRPHQRGHAVFVFVRNARAVFDQAIRRFGFRVHHRGVHQGRRIAGVAGVHVGFRVDQGGDALQIGVLSGGKEKGGQPVFIGGVHVRARLDHLPQYVRRGVDRRRHQRGDAAAFGDGQIDAAGQFGAQAFKITGSDCVKHVFRHGRGSLDKKTAAGRPATVGS